MRTVLPSQSPVRYLPCLKGKARLLSGYQQAFTASHGHSFYNLSGICKNYPADHQRELHLWELHSLACAGMRSNSTTLDLNDPSLPGANAGPTDPVQVMLVSKCRQYCIEKL